jgi:two-component system nitrate/nitrite response regulator NarL
VPHVLIAADDEWLVDEVRAALEGLEGQDGAPATFTICRSGHAVVPAAARRTPDLAVLDLQLGNMGGMAVCMSLRLDESGGRLPHIKVLILLDRAADLHLARRAGADGWLLKPLDPVRLSHAARRILRGDHVYEGLPAGMPAHAPDGVPLPATPPDPASAEVAEASGADGESARGDEVAAS